MLGVFSKRSVPLQFARVGLLAALAGCSPDESASDPGFGGRGRVANTRGSAVALTYDEKVAVVTQRTSGVVTVMSDPLDEHASVRAEFPFAALAESKPWAAVIGADDDTAYVVLRGLKQVVRLSGLHGTPQITGEADVGSEPTAIAISPSGARLYVANWGEGTISVILTKTLEEAKWDLNGRLAAKGLLGDQVIPAADAATGVWTEADYQEQRRPGLAHPRALAMTDDGDADDADEVLYATEFFSQPIVDAPSSDPDRSRQGIVYATGVTTGQPVPDVPFGILTLSAVETGFPDAEGSPTSCFPNQLYAAAVDRDRLLVTSMCASPRGPVEPGPTPDVANNNFKTLVHPVVFAVDTTNYREIPEAGIVLTRKLEDSYSKDGAGAEKRMPLIPNDIAIAPAAEETPDESRRAYVTAFGSDALFAVRYDAAGVPTEVGTQGRRFVDLGPALPIGVALSRFRPVALALNDYTDTLAVVSRETEKVEARRATGGESIPEEQRVPEDLREGRRLFATGLDLWSFEAAGWSSCESCHPDGLSDGVTWRFARGPRRTLSTAGTYYGDKADRRLLLWTANVDEVHDVEAIARGVSGGIGGILWNPYGKSRDCRLLYDTTANPVGGDERCAAPKHTSSRLNGMNGSLAEITSKTVSERCDGSDPICDINASRDWERIDAFIRSVRAPRAPTTLDARSVKDGELKFREAKCAACHGGPGWTLSRVFYGTADRAKNGELPFDKPAEPAGVPERERLLGRLRVAEYQVPAGDFRPLNPAASQGTATFRSSPPKDVSPADIITYLYGKPADYAPSFRGLTDQINCALRAVGTFPVQPIVTDPANPPPPKLEGRVAPGAPPIQEIRRVLRDPPAGSPAGTPRSYGDELAGGRGGFNIPTLAGMATAGAFFHAGNARTLEELLHETFATHHAALSPGLKLTAQDVRNLVSYLLAIDESGAQDPIDVPMIDAGGPFNPDLCAQFPSTGN
jgi:hypothetical protein